MLTTADIIRIKRDGGELDEAAIGSFVHGVADESVSEAQIGAFTMAVYLNGMTATEQAALTRAMLASGTALTWDHLDGPVLDKHSTGGVGDLVSLVLGPLLAACGAFVPMISGRGLGHTGGTLDKLESIPGLDVHPSLDSMRRIVAEVGIAMVGQGPELTPADRRMYAVRDVTATVSCIPLIVSSILSKKLAEGLDGLVMDVKTGNGAFMTELSRSRELAANITEVARSAGLDCAALITDMNQPLADAVGNALEMREAIGFLTGAPRTPRLEEVVLALGAEMLLMGRLVEDRQAALDLMQAKLDSGAAAERFARMVARQGGPRDLLEKVDHYLARAPVVAPLAAPVGGYVVAYDTRGVGHCVGGIGGGRRKVGDTIDPRVGLTGLRHVGERVEPGEPLAMIHAANESDWAQAAEELAATITIGAETLAPLPAVYPATHDTDDA